MRFLNHIRSYTLKTQPPKTTLFGGEKEPGLRAASAAPIKQEATLSKRSRQKPRFLAAKKNPGSARPVPRQ